MCFRFVLYKGVPLLLHTLSHHIQSIVIQRHGCILLYTLCSVSPEICKTLYSLGGDVAAINAMTAFRCVIESSCLIVFNFSLCVQTRCVCSAVWV